MGAPGDAWRGVSEHQQFTINLFLDERLIFGADYRIIKSSALLCLFLIDLTQNARVQCFAH